MAGAMDMLKGLPELLGSSDSSGKVEGKGLLGGIFGKILEKFGIKNPEVAREAQEAKNNAETVRAGLFSEISKSLFLRQFPRLAAITDVGKQISGKKNAEVVPWQNEFETISAFLLLIPGDWRRIVTDLFSKSSIFRALVEYWPGLDGVDIPLIGQYLPESLGNSNIRQRILDNGDPEAVIAALRVMHQDLFVTGKVSFDQVKQILGGSDLGAAAGLLGGGAALAAGARALEGGGNSPAAGPSGEPKAVEAVKAAVTGAGPLKDKKILDLQRQHPEKESTAMQNKVLELLKKLNVLESAVLISGEWLDNNDEVTVGYIFENNVYFLTYDEDLASADISVRNSQGINIYKETDYFSLNASANASAITTAMRKSTSSQPQPTATTAPANDNNRTAAATPPAAPTDTPTNADGNQPKAA